MSAPLPKRQREAMQRDDGGFTAGMIRHHIADCIDIVPTLAVKLQVALELGADDNAYDLLAAIRAAVVESITSMNELRRETGKGGA
jgi:hypothetical protein